MDPEHYVDQLKEIANDIIIEMQTKTEDAYLTEKATQLQTSLDNLGNILTTSSRSDIKKIKVIENLLPSIVEHCNNNYNTDTDTDTDNDFRSKINFSKSTFNFALSSFLDTLNRDENSGLKEGREENSETPRQQRKGGGKRQKTKTKRTKKSRSRRNRKSKHKKF